MCSFYFVMSEVLVTINPEWLTGIFNRKGWPKNIKIFENVLPITFSGSVWLFHLLQWPNQAQKSYGKYKLNLIEYNYQVATLGNINWVDV